MYTRNNQNKWTKDLFQIKNTKFCLSTAILNVAGKPKSFDNEIDRQKYCFINKA